MYRNNLLSLLTVLLITPLAGGVLAQGQMRGESDFSATHRAIEMVMIVEEIEDAGYVEDVEEAFDEEGEEGAWVGSDADDIDASRIQQEDADILDMEDVSDIEDAIESEDIASDDTQLISEEELGEEATQEESGIEVEEDVYGLVETEEESTEDSQEWWEETDMDDSWNDLIDEWELEALENSYEEEDMAVLEAMYENG